VGQAVEYPDTAVHQTERQGISSDYVNGTKGRLERGTMICSGGDPDVSGCVIKFGTGAGSSAGGGGCSFVAGIVFSYYYRLSINPVDSN